MSAPVRLELPDAGATRELGRRLGRAARAGDVIGLVGPLGAGKTTLAQGLAEALGVTGPVPSPTFVLIREYAARLPLAHADAYRLSGADEAAGIGLEELIEGAGVVVVEWAERIADLLPERTLWIRLAPDGDGRLAELASPELSRWLDSSSEVPECR